MNASVICAKIARFASEDGILTVWGRHRHKKTIYKAIGWN